jgi:hypothetical protein
LTVETEANRELLSTNEGVLPWLVRWARRASSRVQNIIFLAAHFFFSYMCPHRAATWAASRDWSPVSSYVSLVLPKQIDRKIRGPVYPAVLITSPPIEF